MKTLALITARGGSKRIPRKNIKDFNGKPIMAYSIEAALKSGVYDEVMVSTDDEEIADIARKFGAKVPFLRSEKTSNDFATTTDVIEEVIEEYHKLGQDFDMFTCIRRAERQGGGICHHGGCHRGSNRHLSRHGHGL